MGNAFTAMSESLSAQAIYDKLYPKVYFVIPEDTSPILAHTNPCNFPKSLLVKGLIRPYSTPRLTNTKYDVNLVELLVVSTRARCAAIICDYSMPFLACCHNCLRL